jgi:hypothetical protein
MCGQAFILVAFELAHILIFLVAMTYVASAILVVVAMRRTRQQWDQVQFQDVKVLLDEGDERKIQCKIYGMITVQQCGTGCSNTPCHTFILNALAGIDISLMRYVVMWGGGITFI